VIEDEEELREPLGFLLRDYGYAVDLASSVAMAGSLLSSNAYDLVLADVRLRDGTGLDIADKAVEKGTNVLVVTGYVPHLFKADTKRYDFLLKPVSAEEIAAAVAAKIGPGKT
jgi:DNA-binding NtrC family response regulator